MDGSARDFFLVHVQKTGGCSIKGALGWRSDEVDHHLAIELRERVGHPQWDRAFKFAFARNPWERLVSWWSMIDASRDAYRRGAVLDINPRFLATTADPASGESLRPKNFFSYVVEHASTFEEFLTKCAVDIPDPDGPKCIFRNQLDYMIDEAGELMVDFVGSFERLQQDFDAVCDAVYLPRRKLKVINASVHAHYSRYYTPYLADLVGDAFQRDIRYFGYRFEAEERLIRAA